VTTRRSTVEPEASSQKLPKAFVTIHRRPQSSLYTLLVIIQGLYTLLVIGKLHICSPPPRYFCPKT
jgi:hypothetical protein